MITAATVPEDGTALLLLLLLLMQCTMVTSYSWGRGVRG